MVDLMTRVRRIPLPAGAAIAAAVIASSLLASSAGLAQAPQGKAERAPPAQQTPSLGICMEPKERLDLSLASIGRELAVYLQKCLSNADALPESGRTAANAILNAPKERKALFKAAGAVAVKAFERAMPVGGQELYDDFLEGYAKNIRGGLTGDEKVIPELCSAYFGHMASTLSGPREALIVVVISRARRFQPLFPDCAKAKPEERP